MKKKAKADLLRLPRPRMEIAGVIATQRRDGTWRETCPHCHKRLQGALFALHMHNRVCRPTTAT